MDEVQLALFHALREARGLIEGDAVRVREP